MERMRRVDGEDAALVLSMLLMLLVLSMLLMLLVLSMLLMLMRWCC